MRHLLRRILRSRQKETAKTERGVAACGPDTQFFSHAEGTRGSISVVGKEEKKTDNGRCWEVIQLDVLVREELVCIPQDKETETVTGSPAVKMTVKRD